MSHRSVIARLDPTRPDSITGSARARRWAELNRRFPDFKEMRVLDLGGAPESWAAAPVVPDQVIAVNLEAKPSPDPRIVAAQGDACQLADELRRERFDMVFSNSLMEHVGGHHRRQQLADTVHAMAEHHWVQTPYRYFPVEPHWVFPGMQFLPHEARVQVSQRWSRGHVHTPTRAEAEEMVNEVELVGITQMRGYFPTSEMWRERFAGLTKSIVAVR